jgi:hypothetical protein
MPEKSRLPSHSADLGPLSAAPSRIHVVAFGSSLGLFFAVSFVLCVLFYFLFPEMALNHVVLRLLPGLGTLTGPSFALGLVESFAYGWYVALIFGPLYNFFAGRLR